MKTYWSFNYIFQLPIKFFGDSRIFKNRILNRFFLIIGFKVQIFLFYVGRSGPVRGFRFLADPSPIKIDFLLVLVRSEILYFNACSKLMSRGS